MAYNSTPDIKPIKYHSCDTPRGMCYYVLDDLTKTQQTKLNELKIKVARDNKQYLQHHPEVRACVALLNRHIFRLRPKKNIYDAVARFFARSRVDIEEEVYKYIESTRPTVEGDSAVGLFASPVSGDSFSLEGMSSFDISSLMSDTSQDDMYAQYSYSMQNIDLSDVKVVESDTPLRSVSQAVTVRIDVIEDTERLRNAALQEMMADIINKNIIDMLKDDLDKPSVSFTTMGAPLQTKVSFSPRVMVSHGPRSFVRLIDLGDQDDDGEIHTLFTIDDEKQDEVEAKHSIEVLSGIINEQNEDKSKEDNDEEVVLSGVIDEPNEVETKERKSKVNYEEPQQRVEEHWVSAPAARGTISKENVIHLGNIQSDKELFTSIKKHVEEDH